MSSQASNNCSKYNPDSLVKLNVGGKAFTKFYSTLSASTFFQNLLTKDTMETKTIINDGEIFINRSAILFRDILLFLRTSIIFAVDIDKLNALQLEAQYYQIDSMMQAVQACINENSKDKGANPIVYENLGLFSKKLQQKTLYLTEETEFHTLTYQILDIIETSCRCFSHGIHNCNSCSTKLVLLPKTKQNM